VNIRHAAVLKFFLHTDGQTNFNRSSEVCKRAQTRGLIVDCEFSKSVKDGVVDYYMFGEWGEGGGECESLKTSIWL
jgi:hypothetical protein